MSCSICPSKRTANFIRLGWLGAVALGFALLLLLARSGQDRTAAVADLKNSLPKSTIVPIALADFDGDSQPDIATVETGQTSSFTTRYWVAFELSGGHRRTVSITAPAGGLQIVAKDVNGDGYPDIVIWTAVTGHPVAVLLNDGLGSFTESSPSAFLSAFSRSRESVSSKLACIGDQIANTSFRFPSGALSRNGAFGPPSTTWPVGRKETCVSTFAEASYFLSRAPPPPSLILYRGAPALG